MLRRDFNKAGFLSWISSLSKDEIMDLPHMSDKFTDTFVMPDDIVEAYGKRESKIKDYMIKTFIEEDPSVCLDPWGEPIY